jgi:hypothetical protein
MENQTTLENDSKNMRVKNGIGWIMGAFFLLLSLGVFTKSLFGGLALIIGGLILMPVVYKKLPEKFNSKMFHSFRIVSAFVLLLVGLNTLPPPTKSKVDENPSEQNKIQSSNQNSQPAKDQVEQTPVKESAPIQPSNSTYVFDVPSLLHKNIDEITKILGVPKDNSELTQEQMRLGNDEWSKEYEKDGFTLTVTYHVKNRNVIDFFVGANDEIYKNKDKEKMFSLTNTTDSDSRYITSFVSEIKNPSSFTGILIKQR